MNALLILTAATMLSQDKSIVGEDHVPTQIVLKQVGSVSFGDYAGWHVKYSEPHVSGLTTDKLASLVIPEGSIPGIEVDRTTVTLDNRYGQAIRNFSLYGPGPGVRVRETRHAFNSNKSLCHYRCREEGI